MLLMAARASAGPAGRVKRLVGVDRDRGRGGGRGAAPRASAWRCRCPSRCRPAASRRRRSRRRAARRAPAPSALLPEAVGPSTATMRSRSGTAETPLDLAERHPQHHRPPVRAVRPRGRPRPAARAAPAPRSAPSGRRRARRCGRRPSPAGDRPARDRRPKAASPRPARASTSRKSGFGSASLSGSGSACSITTPGPCGATSKPSASEQVVRRRGRRRRRLADLDRDRKQQPLAGDLTLVVRRLEAAVDDPLVRRVLVDQDERVVSPRRPGRSCGSARRS